MLKYENEIWRPIVGYEGYYEVSSFGRVKRVKSITSHNRVRKEKIISPVKFSNGYLFVDLCVRGIRKKKSIHRGVAIAFLSNPYNKEQVNHIDGNKLNNRLDNLEWSTSSENQKHSIRACLRSAKGEKNSQNKLTEKEVNEIRGLLIDGKLAQLCIARIYNVSPSTISSIKHNKSWTHL